MPGQPFSMGVTCHTCLRTAWEGNELPPGKDGEVLLAEFAGPDGAPCPGNNPDCPHKPTAREKHRRRQPATMGELEDMRARLSKLEGKKP